MTATCSFLAKPMQSQVTCSVRKKPNTGFRLPARKSRSLPDCWRRRRPVPTRPRGQEHLDRHRRDGRKTREFSGFEKSVCADARRASRFKLEVRALNDQSFEARAGALAPQDEGRYGEGAFFRPPLARARIWVARLARCSGVRREMKSVAAVELMAIMSVLFLLNSPRTARSLASS